MTIKELETRVCREFDERHLKSRTRYYALDNVLSYVRDRLNGNLSCFNIRKDEFKKQYERYKLSIDRRMSSAESSAINEIYNQLSTTIIESLSISSKPPIEEHNEVIDIEIDAEIDDLLLNDSLKKVSDLEELDFPSVPGMYAIRVIDPEVLPSVFCQELKKRGHNLLYIGIASESLRERLWHQELNHDSPATFFRSLGAVLGYRPESGSLQGKNTRNYKFSKQDTESIKSWIRKNILVNFICVTEDLESNERMLIEKYKPIINIAKNPYKMPILSELREECVKIAKDK